MMCVTALLVWGAGQPGFAARPTSEEVSSALAYDPKGKRDPFLPLVREGRIVTVLGGSASGAVDLSGLKLIGILWDPGGRSLALINDSEVRVGDAVNDYQVSEIREDRVILTRADGEIVVLEIDFETPSQKPKDSAGGGEVR